MSLSSIIINMIPIKGTLKKTDELLVVVIVTNDIQSK